MPCFKRNRNLYELHTFFHSISIDFDVAATSKLQLRLCCFELISFSPACFIIMFISLRFCKDWSKSNLDPVAHNASVKCDRMRSQKIRRRPESCHAYHPQVSPRCHLITMSYSVVKIISRQWLSGFYSLPTGERQRLWRSFGCFSVCLSLPHLSLSFYTRLLMTDNSAAPAILT